MAFCHLLFCARTTFRSCRCRQDNAPPPSSSLLSAHPSPIDREAGGILSCKRPAARLFRPRRRDRCPSPGPMAKEMPGGRCDDRRVAVGTNDEDLRRACGSVRCFPLSSSAGVCMDGYMGNEKRARPSRRALERPGRDERIRTSDHLHPMQVR